MEDPRFLVLEWLRSGAGYDQGVALFSRFGKNRNMATLFPGRKQRYESKLRYELCKSAGIDWRKITISTGPGVPVVDVAFISQTEPGVVDSPDSGADDQVYPPVVRRVIHEYGEAYRERSRLHYQMSTGPGDNTPENMATRRDLLARIKALSLRMDELFSTKDNYIRNKVLPDASVLWPPEKAAVPAVEEKPLPDDTAELRRMKKNLQTYNVKDNNLLLYQSVSVQPEKHPMPSGPRRMGIEKRIQSRLKLIEQIDYKLVGNAG